MYKSEIIESSMKFENKVDMIAMKDVTDCLMLEELANADEECFISPSDYAIIKVQNDRSESKEYEVLIIVDTDGVKYRTGSESFKRAFLDIFNELHGEDIEWSIKVFGKPSKNYNGKKFLTCAVAR